MENTALARFPYLQRIWNLRYFWMSLVKNDLAARYRRSFLGIGWSLARPLGMTLVLCVVFAKFFNMSMGDYAAYLFIGLSFWQFLNECILQGCQCFFRGSAYIRQQQVPLAIFPLRVIMAAGFHAGVALCLALCFAWYFGGLPNPLALLSLIPTIALLVLLGWFLAIMAGMMHTYFPDTQHMLEITLQILFYLTPIMYRPETISGRARLSWIIELNPLTSLLAMIRNPILEGTLPSLFNVQVAITLVLIAGSLAFLMLRKLERTLVFWV